MDVDYHILDEAAKQLRESIGTSIPLDPPDWPAEDLAVLRDLMNELCWGDFMDVLRVAAARMADPDDGEG